jgi:hypothetical protein
VAHIPPTILVRRRAAATFRRDYADVPPTRSVYTGTAREILSVRAGLQSL